MTTITKKNPVEKITYAQAFTAVLDILNGMDADEVLTTVTVGKETNVPLTVATAIEKVNQQIDKLNRKSTAPKKPSTASVQNAEYAKVLLTYLTANAGTGFTSAELCAVEGMPEDCSTSKISAIMRHFPEDVVLNVEKVKGKNVYSVPSADAE